MCICYINIYDVMKCHLAISLWIYPLPAILLISLVFRVLALGILHAYFTTVNRTGELSSGLPLL